MGREIRREYTAASNSNRRKHKSAARARRTNSGPAARGSHSPEPPTCAQPRAPAHKNQDDTCSKSLPQLLRPSGPVSPNFFHATRARHTRAAPAHAPPTWSKKKKQPPTPNSSACRDAWDAHGAPRSRAHHVDAHARTCVHTRACVHARTSTHAHASVRGEAKRGPKRASKLLVEALGGCTRRAALLALLLLLGPLEEPHDELRGGEEAHEDAQDERECANAEAQEPVFVVDRNRLEHLPSVLHAQRLHNAAEHDDGEVDRVPEDAREDVLVVVDLARVDLVEDLRPYEGVVDDRVPVVAHVVLALPVGLKGGALCGVPCDAPIGAVREDLGALQQKIDHNGQLVRRLHEDVAPHVTIHERLIPPVGLALEEISGGQLGSERQRTERVHDEVDPQELHGLERRAKAERGPKGAHEERNDVDGELEL
mmetsp:Transcript_26903/g.66291  ORF Transcript_26903/g.66291 Transcript_26903/m.66291 type:complete len:426 (+) Transcript_26903:48-1325(+)